MDERWQHLAVQEHKLHPHPLQVLQHDSYNAKRRKQVLEWLLSMAVDSQLSRQVLQLSRQYLDRFYSIVPLDCSKILQASPELMATAALNIALKMENFEPTHLLMDVTAHRFRWHNIVAAEKWLLETLGWNLNPPTVCSQWLLLTQRAIQHCLSEGRVEDADCVLSVSKQSWRLDAIEALSLEPEFVRFYPTAWAAALLAAAVCLDPQPMFSAAEWMSISDYAVTDLMPAIRMLHALETASAQTAVVPSNV